MTTTTWCQSDAWFFETVGSCDRGTGATLADVLAVGDYINKAIFNREEIEYAVNRLMGAGLLRAGGTSFEVTEEGRKLLRRPTGRGPLARITQLDQMLRALPVNEPDTRWSLPGPEYARAAAEYRDTFARASGRRGDEAATDRSGE